MKILNLTNEQVVLAARDGRYGVSSTYGMSTHPGAPNRWGYFPSGLKSVFQHPSINGKIEQTVYSYDTPIALKVMGAWIQPWMMYSMTTSAKHQSQLYILETSLIPYDCSAQELLRVINGYMYYTPTRRTAGIGRWYRGWNWIEGC